MTMTFEEAFKHQIEMQVSVYGDGTPLEEFSDERRAEFIKNNVLAMLDEAHEVLAEVGWKPWATSRHLNREAFKGELIDVLHFYFNLMGAAGITPDEILAGYEAKAEKNRKRQSDGYDGVSAKCPKCKRALDDEAVECEVFGTVDLGPSILDGVSIRRSEGVCATFGSWGYNEKYAL